MNNKSERTWWQKPGLGVMYQIEHRPGWRWNRNFDRFNASMMNEKGEFKFTGPYCKIADWVELSRRTGIDYHIFEVKWHDGIVWFDTSLTDWKTPTDYAAQFANLSRKAGIPFMFYYSSIIDHNPQFRDVIPLNQITPSFPVMRDNDTYRSYLEGQMKEIVDGYHPDGMWFDWCVKGMHPSESVVIDFLQKYSPGTVITFNHTVAFNAGLLHSVTTPLMIPILSLAAAHRLFFERLKHVKKDATERVHYLTYEAHTVRAAWERANLYRRSGRPWELVGPAGRAWDKMALRDDIYDLVRMAAMVMANGGRYAIGAAAQMDGSIYPDHVRQLELLGEWYGPRRELFTEAFPMGYKGQRIPGVGGYGRDMCATGSQIGHDNLIHLFNLRLDAGSVTLRFDSTHWSKIGKVYLEPEHREPTIGRAGRFMQVTIPAKDVDRVDTILRIAGG